VLRGAMVTADRYPVGTVVCVRDPEMNPSYSPPNAFVTDKVRLRG
jgi:hypothetical protein